VEQFKEGWCQFFFKGLIEFSRESIRSWTFLFGETLPGDLFLTLWVVCGQSLIITAASIAIINITSPTPSHPSHPSLMTPCPTVLYVFY
jgi:hypothetical protein